MVFKINNFMKIYILILNYLFVNISFNYSQSKMKYHIEGELIGLNNSKIYLTNKPNGIMSGYKVIYFDSCVAKNNKFTFIGYFEEITFYSIETGTGPWRSFLIDSSKITIRGKLDSIFKCEVKGSREHDQMMACYLEYEKELSLLSNYYSFKLDTLRKNNDSINQNKYIDSLTLNSKRLSLNRLEALSKYNDSYVSLLLLDKLKNNKFILKDTLHKIYKQLPDKLRSTNLGIKLLEYYNNKKLIKNYIVDSMYLMNANQNLSYIKLSQNKFKVLNFWANWCIPCIEKIPEIKILTKSLLDRADIYNISLDQNFDVWKKSLNKFSLNGINFLDLKKIYEIPSIPRMVLLDSQNKIILEDTNIKELIEYFKIK